MIPKNKKIQNSTIKLNFQSFELREYLSGSITSQRFFECCAFLILMRF